MENRRTLMARQIKLRRDQQKQRKAQLSAAAAASAATITISNNQSNLDSEQGITILALQPKATPPL